MKIRLDKFLLSKNKSLNRSAIYQLIKSGHVLVNNLIVFKSGLLINPESDQIKLLTPKIIKNTKIKIIYENNDVIVINKPYGLLTHQKGLLNTEDSVADFIKNKIDFDYLNNRNGIVHRLDRLTSGVIICAKNEPSRLWLTKQFETRKVVKTYYALCLGHFDTKEAIIDLPILRNPSKPQTFIVHSQGKQAQTYYKVISESKHYALIKLQPKTGRTHQLRVHLNYIGHPILGDPLYGDNMAKRMYLHASELSIRINKNDEPKTFKVPIPSSFRKELNEDK